MQPSEPIAAPIYGVWLFGGNGAETNAGWVGNLTLNDVWEFNPEV
jgi:hypothetical protein